MTIDRTLLIGIGAQKAGTTWLADYLATHPEVFMSPIKELHFFDALWRPDLCGALARRVFARYHALAAAPQLANRARERERLELLSCYRDRFKMNTSSEKYLEYFLSRAGDRQVMCEITPSYAMLNRDGFASIANLHALVKFVFLLRNPIDRFWSQLRFTKSRAISANGSNGVLIGSALSDPQFILRTRYDRTLSELSEVVPRNRIFVEFHERLFRDEALTGFCDFLDVGFRPGDYARKVHETSAAALGDGERSLVYKAFAPVYEWARTEFGVLPESWQEDLNRYG